MTAAPRAEGRAAELYAAHDRTIGVITDHQFAGLLVAEWLFGIALALWVSPRTWAGATSGVHPHLLAAIFLGGVIVAFPAALGARRAGHRSTRFAIAVAQMLMGELFIHLTGGRIETHFFIFGSLAFLAFYRDYPVLLVGAAVVVVDHALRGAIWPQSLFGVASASLLRTGEHTLWVVFEGVFLVAACVRGRREMRDIAYRHARLEEEQETCASAEAASRAKSEFLANMSHEIRTPMAAVLGYADLLLDSGLDAEERVGHVQTIRRNGEHLLELLDDILDLSKVEAGQATVEAIPCSPSRIVVDVASMMRVRAAAKDLWLEIDYLTPVPETIAGDPLRLRQILTNLLGNAIKFTAAGGVRLLVRCDPGAPAGPRLSFCVADTGIGLTREQLGRLFQPFAQGDSSTTRRFGGTGLGLVISRRFARMLGGDITVESVPGQGSAFTLTVATGPLGGVRMLANLEEAGDTEALPATMLPGPSGLAGVTVLLAEDGRDNQRLISTYLRKAGASVVIVENGVAALASVRDLAARGERFDVVLMDMQMPELDGYGAAASLRATGYRGPILALTAHAMSGDRERCLAAGCDDYLTKPINRAELCDKVGRAARRLRERPTPPPASGPRPSAPSLPPLVSTCADDPEMASDPEMTELLDAYVAELPDRCRAIRSAAEAPDVAELGRLAHQMKGSAGGYGFAPLTAAAAALEEAVLRGAVQADLRRRVAEIDGLCRRARAR